MLIFSEMPLPEHRPATLATAAVAVAAGGGWNEGHTCAILDNGELKCWGYGAQVQLGTGNADNVGWDAGQMGDNLAALELGTRTTALRGGVAATLVSSYDRNKS